MVSQEVQIKEREQVLSMSQSRVKHAVVHSWLPFPTDSLSQYCCLEGRGTLAWMSPIGTFCCSLHNTKSTQAPGWSKGTLVKMSSYPGSSAGLRDTENSQHLLNQECLCCSAVTAVLLTSVNLSFCFSFLAQGSWILEISAQ